MLGRVMDCLGTVYFRIHISVSSVYVDKLYLMLGFI